ncbi:ribosome biogenesis factor YjgA [Desulfospira joergensenii]|uniref:ribosome biogenesis factor YjgA n=1 Tax=Desulfospira joergensenii TaxID=53329 RepID=UPI0003B6D82D|nr:ribosome biogenesis factor YjgA [Desulfospira joergensenii]
MEDEIQHKSRTEKKKEAEELQRLGLELSKLSVQQLKRIKIPEKLRTALIEGKSITSNVAGRRHRQFIGVLMRDVNPESVRLALLQAETGVPVEFDIKKEIQMRIDRLLADDQAEMETVLNEFPGLERQRLRQLLRNIKKEAGASKSRQTLEQLIMAAMNLK